MADSALNQQVWLNVLRKLTAVALNRFGQERLFGGKDWDPVLKGLGKSPADLAADALTEFYANRATYPKAKTEDQIFAVAFRIMSRDFVDAVSKNHAYTTTKATSDEDWQTFAAPPSDDPERVFDAEDLAKKFYRYVDGDQELKDVIDAAAYLATNQREPLKRSDIADLLSVSADEISKRNNRLNYKFHADDGRSHSD
ncbi:MAG: hypothetical protein IPM59_09545 [Chloracidobacterium sp.]|nr:hypothetical protein [Chloracidobacterium sp.]